MAARDGVLMAAGGLLVAADGVCTDGSWCVH